MDTKKKIIAIVVIASCAMMPLLVSADTNSSSSTGFFGSIASFFEGGWNFIHNVFSPNDGVSSSTAGQASDRNYITLQLGDKSVLVTAAQELLIKQGYLQPPATGVFDINTQAAVEALQKAQKIPVTGYLTIASSSLSSIFSMAAPTFTSITVGATGTRATDIQKFLIAKGNLKATSTTAYFGTATQGAVKAFQESHNLPQTGIIDKATFAAMNGGAEQSQ